MLLDLLFRDKLSGYRALVYSLGSHFYSITRGGPVPACSCPLACLVASFATTFVYIPKSRSMEISGALGGELGNFGIVPLSVAPATTRPGMASWPCCFPGVSARFPPEFYARRVFMPEIRPDPGKKKPSKCLA